MNPGHGHIGPRPLDQKVWSHWLLDPRIDIKTNSVSK